jgi:small ligand-binding sensory domain FIST|tara:strand:- start:210 stop:452 length:243 start_codon:yes stop_codon:yes gene_type:complete
MNRFGAALSTESDLGRAIAECTEKTGMILGNEKPDIALVFVSHEHREEFGALAKKIQEATGALLLIGCSAETVVGGGREI